MEVGARVETTRWDDRTPPVHVATAFLVMVGVDESGRPRQAPTLEPVTEEEKRRFRAAQNPVASTASRSAPPSAISARVRRPSSAHGTLTFAQLAQFSLGAVLIILWLC